MSTPNDTEVPEAFISFNSPAEGRYHSSYIGMTEFTIAATGQPFIKLKTWINTPRPAPAGCPTCAKVTSLIPELSVETGRVN